MNAEKLGFHFVGGFKDGCIIRGDSLKAAERSRVHGFATLTHGGAIGKKIRGRSKQSHEHVHEQLAEGETVEESPNQTYEVVSNLADDDGFVMVSCHYVAATASDE